MTTTERRATDGEQFSPYERCQLQLCRCAYSPRRCACTATVSVHDLRAVLWVLHHATSAESTPEEINEALRLAFTPNGGK